MQDVAQKEHWQQNNMYRMCFTSFFEELKNIEYRVAWFLGELCTADEGCAKR
jgi:hypothetical protein